MRKLIGIAFLCIGLSSCSGGPLKTTVSSIESTWNLIKPEYMAYIQADASLDTNSKNIRQTTATQLSELIAEALKSYKEK